MKILRLVGIVLVAFISSPDLVGQEPDSLVGTWRLVSASASTGNDKRNETPFGPSPSGLMIYTREGTMSAVISYSNRKALSADRVAAPINERAEAFATFFAYAGRYSINGNSVVHHVKVASVPNWVNTDLARVIVRQGNRMTLQTPPLAVGGEIRTSELVWERVQ